MDTNDPKPSTQINGILDGKLREASRESRPFGRTTIEATVPSGKVTVIVEDAERFGVMAGSVGAERQGGKPGDVPAQAEDAVRRLNYLQEPLAIIETDD